MDTSTTVHYLICANIATAWDLPLDTKWLGCSHPDRNPPQWTTEEFAYQFLTLESAATYFKNGNGYEIGFSKPIASSIRIVQKTIQQTVERETFPLESCPKTGSDFN